MSGPESRNILEVGGSEMADTELGIISAQARIALFFIVRHFFDLAFVLLKLSARACDLRWYFRTWLPTASSVHSGTLRENPRDDFSMTVS